MTGPPLTPIEQAVLNGALDGSTMKSIADQFGVLKPTISKIAHSLRKRGLNLPNWPNHVYMVKPPPPPRFHAIGKTPEGLLISCTADTQEQADAHIAAMVAP